jgi:hypothetical protein
MSRYLAGLVLALVFCVSLVASAPARLLGALLPGDQVTLQGFEGTLWRGSASRALVRTPAGYLHLGALDWSLHPLSLLLFAPRLTLDSAWGSQSFRGDIVLRGSGDLDLKDVEALVAADLLRQFAPVALGGNLSLQVGELLLRDALPVAGEGRLVWQGGSWQSPQGPLPLGTYVLDFRQATEQKMEGEVITISGPVTANGTVALEGIAYDIDVLVGSKRPLDPQLQQALSLIATPVGQEYRVQLQGDLR